YSGLECRCPTAQVGNKGREFRLKFLFGALNLLLCLQHGGMLRGILRTEPIQRDLESRKTLSQGDQHWTPQATAHCMYGTAVQGGLTSLEPPPQIFCFLKITLLLA